jgi:DNA-binding LacI/PurR family transcriptional regulator
VYVSRRDASARSGVRLEAASKVLNGRPGVVSAQTREGILSAAHESGHVPDALAPGLVRRSSVTVIGVLGEYLSDLVVPPFVRAARRAVANRVHAAGQRLPLEGSPRATGPMWAAATRPTGCWRGRMRHADRDPRIR